MVIKKVGIIVKYDEKEKEAIDTVCNLVNSMMITFDDKFAGEYEGYFTDADEYLDSSMLSDLLEYLSVFKEITSIQ